jgi:hypothetical protein
LSRIIILSILHILPTCQKVILAAPEDTNNLASIFFAPLRLCGSPALHVQSRRKGRKEDPIQTWWHALVDFYPWYPCHPWSGF